MQLCRRPITILQLRHIEQVFWQPTVRQVQRAAQVTTHFFNNSEQTKTLWFVAQIWYGRTTQPEMTFWNRRGTSRYSNSLSPLFYCCTTQRLEAGVIQKQVKNADVTECESTFSNRRGTFSYIRKVFSNSSFCFSLHLPQPEEAAETEEKIGRSFVVGSWRKAK